MTRNIHFVIGPKKNDQKAHVKHWPVVLVGLFFQLMITSCGKNISEKDIRVARQIEGENSPHDFNLELNTAYGRRRIFRMPRAATFKIPQTILVKGGTTTDKTVVVRYNGSDVEKEDYEFQCSYDPEGSVNKMFLQKCTNYYGENLGDISGHLFSLEYGDIIDMEVLGPIHFDIVIENFHEMNWF